MQKLTAHDKWSTTPVGTPVYAIDDKQNTVRGRFQKILPTGEIELLDDKGDVRTFHGRYVTLDTWRSLEDL